MARPIRALAVSEAQRAALAALVRALDGGGHRGVQGHRAATVARQRHQAAPDADLQAVERPGLPLGVGHIRTKTNDYIRHGTITLFAALSYLDGKIFSQTAARHTHRQWLAFLKHLDAEAPGDLVLHLIIDNDATHKHPAVKRRIATRNARQRRAHRNERMVLHFTPTALIRFAAQPWMNLVERFFRDLTEDAVREGSFSRVAELVRAIESYLAEHNKAPKRYLWNAQGKDILLKINRARAALAQAQDIA